jgi:hypothetical protein
MVLHMSPPCWHRLRASPNLELPVFPKHSLPDCPEYGLPNCLWRGSGIWGGREITTSFLGGFLETLLYQMTSSGQAGLSTALPSGTDQSARNGAKEHSWGP